MTTPAQPQWLQPASQGLLSNTRGSNTGADALTLKTRYSNPAASGDPAGQMRMLATRTGSAASGPAFTPQVAWDSGWLGAPTTNALPTALRQAGVAELNNRVYVCGGIDASNNIYSAVWSAPINGGSVGTWRLERPMTAFWAAGATTASPSPRYAHACCIGTFGNSGGSGSAGLGIGGNSWLICHGGIGPNGFITNSTAATINSDGTLGPWQTLVLGLTPLAFAQMTPIPNQYITYGLALTGGCTTGYTTNVGYTWATAIRNAPANSGTWDIPNGWWVRLPNLPASGTAGHVQFFDWANTKLMILRGSDGTTSQPGGFYLNMYIDIVNWLVTYSGGWTAITGSGTGASQNDAAVIYYNCPSQGSWGGSPQSYVYIIGGSGSAALPPPVASAVTTVGLGTFTFDTSNNPTVAWSAGAHPLPTALSGLRGVLGGHLSGSVTSPGPWPDANVARVTTLGGGNGTNASVTTVQSNSTAPLGSGDLLGSWISGVGAGLAAGDLGTGGAIALSSDATAPASSQDVTINYAAVTTPTVAGFSDGDRVQLQVWFTDKTGGDVSSAAYSSLLIGQPPTLGAIAPSGTITNGQPTTSFTYTSGAGGSGEYSYRIQVKQGATVLYDTGTRYDNANSALLTIAPLLTPSTTFTNGLIITATSKDTPYPGSSNTVTSTTSFSTSAFAVPGAPTGFTATPSGPNGNVALSWTGTSTYGRIYYRRTAVGGTWYLLADNVAGTSYAAMDHIALGVGYDFAASLVNATPAESVLSGISAATIPLGSYSAFLHVAGAGSGTAFQVQGSPTVAKKRSALDLLGFNQTAPLRRYGGGNYHQIKAKALLVDSTPATLKTLQGIIDSIEAGIPVFWRDALGGMLVMTLDSDQAITILPPWNREVDLALTETQDTIGPYVAAGSAQGYLTLVGGSKPPLSLEESLL